MPQWKLRAPASLREHKAFLHATVATVDSLIEGDPVKAAIGRELNRAEASQLQDRYRYWRWCIRKVGVGGEESLGRLAGMEKGWTLRSKVTPSEGDSGKFDVWIYARTRAESDDLERLLAD